MEVNRTTAAPKTTNGECFNVYSTRSNMAEGQRLFLIIYTLAINGLLNFILNCLVLLCLKMSKQLKKYSMRLIAYISTSDICISITTPSVIYILLTRYKVESYCTLEITAQGLNIFFAHVTAYLVALIAYDRYARVKYLNTYKMKMSEKRTKCLVLFVIIMALLNTLLYTFGSLFGFYKTSWFLVLVIDTIAVILMASFYISATIIIKKRRSKADNANIMKAVDKSITSLTKKFMISIVLFYGLYLIFNFTNMMAHEGSTGKTRSWLEFLLYFGLLIGVTNSVSNALIFISVNKKSQRYLRKTFLKNSNEMVEVSTTISTDV